MRHHLLTRLGKKLRAARCGRGLTQQDIARDAGLTQQTISLIERGQVDPSLLTVLSICDALLLNLRDAVDWSVIGDFKPTDKYGKKAK